MRRYQPRPRYATIGGQVEHGYGGLAREIAQRRAAVVVLDGPATIDWSTLAGRLGAELGRAGVPVRVEHTRAFFADRAAIERRTLDGPLRTDPDFAPLFGGDLAELLAELPRATREAGTTTLLLGPGAALADHDLLWVVDQPKRVAAGAVREGRAAPIGLTPGDPDSARRLVFIEWPVLDRHRVSLLPTIDRFIDLSDPSLPRSLGGESLRASLDGLVGGPFRTLPTFSPGAWGGQWLRRTLGIPADGPNLAWSYELIAPESSVLLGDEPALEVGLEMLIGQARDALLGAEVAARFGSSFPIRFDYLDTMDGGHLSIHCHPLEEYMRDVFGWRYTQHETYYVMAATPGSFIFLGLRDGFDEDAFIAGAADSLSSGAPLDVERFVQTHSAELHRLYLIPAGTPHASSAGNVVLEISATPYLYSLRFYDWLRADLGGELRPVHLGHAFANLSRQRTGARVRSELLPAPHELRRGRDFVELDLGRSDELFFAVTRLDIDAGAEVELDTDGRFAVLNLVEGEQAVIETLAGRRHELAYAETIVVPASVGAYRVRAAPHSRCRLIRAFVRPAEG